MDIGGKEIVLKILGPTADYLGEQLKGWTQKRLANISNVFKNAETKIGNKINEEGIVSPKVIRGVIDDASWCEEKLQIEYFGGVLASSRTTNTRDDRGRISFH
jgi:hypothetical protein